MKYLSLFSGIGGFELGIQQAYESNNEHASISEESKQKERPQGRKRIPGKHRPLLRTGNRTAPLCVGFSEIDKYAIQIYEKHFPKHKNYGDITKIAASSLPDFDLLVGGFPCQAFSIAGRRKGFDDTRGTLFFEIARILKEKQPRLFLLENVKGLLSHDNGRTFKVIITTLDELGYDLQWQVLNSTNWIPQNRERIFIVGHLRGTSRPKVFPFLEGSEGNTAEIQKPIIRGRERDTVGCLDTRGVNAYDRADLDKIIYGTTARRLTPLECERLQGFPDEWTGGGTSDTQRYKCVGNAVTVKVIEKIISKMLY